MKLLAVFTFIITFCVGQSSELECTHKSTDELNGQPKSRELCDKIAILYRERFCSKGKTNSERCQRYRRELPNAINGCFE